MSNITIDIISLYIFSKNNHFLQYFDFFIRSFRNRTESLSLWNIFFGNTTANNVGISYGLAQYHF